MKRPTLKRRLYALFFQWFLLFLALAGVVTVMGATRFRQAAVEERLLLARAFARHLDTAVSDLFHGLRDLAVLPDVLDSASIEKLRSVRFQHLFRDAIYVLDEDHEVVMADPPWVDPLPASALKRHEAVTPLLRKGDDGKPLVALIEPFEIDRKRYRFVAEMDLPGVLLTTLLAELAAGSDLDLFVVDAEGTILAAPTRERVFHTVPAAAEVGAQIRLHRPFVETESTCWACNDDDLQDDGNQDYATVMVPLQYAPWGLVLQEPRDRMFRAVYDARRSFVGTLILVAALGVFLSWALKRTVAAPIQELAAQAELLRRGELERPIGVAGDHEIVVLGRTMDEARQRIVASLADLSALNETLEEQVEERTAEIEGLLQKTLAQDAQRRVLVRRLLAAGEEERKRIARELHDEVSQLLTVVQLSLEDLPGEAGEANRARELLVRTQEELHRIIYDLRPSLLDDLGLAAAVKWYAENYLEPRGLETSLEIEDDLRLPPEVEITAFRIYQEIVTNILRHSRAENVAVELYKSGDTLTLTVEDDGVGFNPDKLAAGNGRAGAGIVGMRERAEIVGGRLEIDSGPGTGTQVRVELPVAAEAVS